MAKVFLINPHSPEFLQVREKYLPLGLLYLSSSLKKSGHEVLLTDVNNFQTSTFLEDKTFDLNGYYEAMIKKEISDFSPDLIGISVHFSGRFRPAIELARLVKRDFADVSIIMGGIHPTIFPEEILKEYSCVDFILRGEGEITLTDLVNTIERKLYHFDKIDGLCYRDNGRIIVNTKKHFIEDVDTIPFPDYDVINLSDYYFDTSRWINPKKLPINLSVYILSSRSCPHQCTYCSMFMAHGPSFRMRSAENVVDEIEYLYKRFNHHYYSFMDDNLTLNKSRMIEICNSIIRRRLDIQFDTPNGLAINTLDKDILDAMVNAGMIKVCLAIESGSPEIRKSINKRLSQEKIFEVFELVNRYPELAYNVFFIIGFPNETFATLEETYQLIKQLGLKKAVISFATPFPGTELYEECVKNKLIDIDQSQLHNVDKFYYGSDAPFIKPYNLEKQDLIDLRLKVYRELNMTKQLELLTA